ncbi:MAG: hypothetical protein OXE41_01340 [Gammaproteobacteria bacterium]|nr:hypothetical protein [Gammaproteobacteria bacterium]MCY4218333.1 hypothetical protein [Gammaproteobacteria bacterium]MCY4274035.1 hypothetical protein [Gammaproteobacteria bacterium]
MLDFDQQDRVRQSYALPDQVISGTDDCEVLKYVVQPVVRRIRRTKYARSCQCIQFDEKHLRGNKCSTSNKPTLSIKPIWQYLEQSNFRTILMNH